MTWTETVRQHSVPAPTFSNRITIKTGTEGPRHDPYAYTEITVDGRNGRTTYHSGLGEWVQAPDGKEFYPGEGPTLTYIFKRFVGVVPSVAERFANMAPYKRHAAKCSSRKFETVSGYPGETLVTCSACGEVVETHFNASAVE
jgi:hypothetical protein